MPLARRPIIAIGVIRGLARDLPRQILLGRFDRPLQDKRESA
jgi:hypothetical protein